MQLQAILTSSNIKSQWLFFISLVLAILFLYFFGVHGVFRSVPFAPDFDVFFLAGQILNTGGNPWRDFPDPHMMFAYPPHSAVLISGYGALPYPLSLGLHSLLNFISIAILVYLANRWFIKVRGLRDCSLLSACCVFLIIGNPFVAKSVYLGQMSLPCIVAALLSWQFKKDKRPILAGILLAIATLKPQVSMFYVLWLMLERDYKILTVGATLALVMMMPALLALGVIETFQSWFSSLNTYMNVPFNRPGSSNVVGLKSVFTSFGISLYYLEVIAIAAIVLLYVYRIKFSDIQIVSVFSIVSLTFIYGHGPDYVAVALFVSYFLYLAIKTKSNLTILFSLFTVTLFYFPGGIHYMLGFYNVHMITTLLLVLMLVLSCRWDETYLKLSRGVTR